jgi:hypothetical protein
MSEVSLLLNETKDQNFGGQSLIHTHFDSVKLNENENENCLIRNHV